eukprot:CAMPEP_0171068216 /NCGR_PEP_ID=MMETSP0766_2-20121228/8438_1 /TAXON_ID=439317 /ORGANISM="Gambierdiscus australes, Strain CAWD 149" /LENGTH=375 /DNA_ID=CAMNT_0011524507 /DNA_START=41 /DNA_END=1166 /DNA_ORIENTATION=+
MAAVAVPQGTGNQSNEAEELRACLAGKRMEAAFLQDQIQRARLDAQQLRLHLQAVGVAHPSLLPESVHAGSGNPEPQQLSELRSLLHWLAESVDLSHHVVFDCGGEVMVGGRRVLLQRMATWQLSGSPLSATKGCGGGDPSRLKLSVPLELHGEISRMLSSARARGGHLDEATVQRLADSWDIVGTEVVSAAMGCPEPAIFLVHKESAQAITITQWPSVEFARSGGPSGTFDPEQHFARCADLATPVKAYKVQMPPESLGPTGPASPALVTVKVSTGDRVEVEREGQWIAGTLQKVDGNVANVRCDSSASPEGVLTVAPLASVRPARSAQDMTSKKFFRHMRAKSTAEQQDQQQQRAVSCELLAAGKAASSSKER